jgi:hypothetical protein
MSAQAEQEHIGEVRYAVGDVSKSKSLGIEIGAKIEA